jgi:hypothetical protein
MTDREKKNPPQAAPTANRGEGRNDLLSNEIQACRLPARGATENGPHVTGNAGALGETTHDESQENDHIESAPKASGTCANNDPLAATREKRSRDLSQLAGAVVRHPDDLRAIGWVL